MNQYSSRREKILEALDKNSAVLLFSGKAPMRSEDEAYPFCVNRNFYYLTGLDYEGMSLLMYNLDGVTHESLFILPFDETLAKWVGGRILADKASEIAKIDDVNSSEDLDDVISSLLNRARKDNNFKLYFDLWHYQMDQENSLSIEYANKLKNRYPALIIKDFYPVLTSMRLVKDKTEIDDIRKAIHITNLGIQEMMKTIKPGESEMAMEGVFNYTLNKSLCHENAFPTIAASGANATVLHYSSNNCIMNDGDLFLCDLGATYNHYCGDISRTFPVNGKFSERQKEIYNIVLGAQKLVEENARPGISIRQLNKMVVDYYKEELPKHNLNEDVSEYYFHSISHHLGLDTHDVSIGANEPLQAGNVITNEPGLYISSEAIGIRIEDDLLINDDGCEVLSSEIIKTVDDIEKFMKEH